MQKEKFDIFKLIEQLETGDTESVKNFTEEQLKEISPYLLQRWLSCTDDQLQILRLNICCNPYSFELAKHKQLLLKLYGVSVSKTRKRYQWIKQKKNESSKSLSVDVVKQFYGYSTKRAEECVSMFSADDIMEMAKDLGYQKAEIDKLKKELK